MGRQKFPRTLPDGIGAGRSPEDYLHRALEGMKEAIPRSHDSQMTAPSEQAFSDAHEFISCLDLNGCAMPEIELIGDGEINFSWELDDDNLQIDLGFYGTGKYSCLRAQRRPCSDLCRRRSRICWTARRHPSAAARLTASSRWPDFR